MSVPRSVQTYVDAFSGGDPVGCAATFAPDGIYADPGTPEPLTGAAIGVHLAEFFRGFPDARCDTEALAPLSTELWVWRWTARGTNTGSYRGIPATGRQLVLPGCEFITLGGDAITRVDGYFDRLTILIQLGLAPQPAAR